MFCPRCGAQHEDAARFCPKCGQALPSAAKARRPRARRSGARLVLVGSGALVVVGLAVLIWYLWPRLELPHSVKTPEASSTALASQVGLNLVDATSTLGATPYEPATSSPAVTAAPSASPGRQPRSTLTAIASPSPAATQTPTLIPSVTPSPGPAGQAQSEILDVLARYEEMRIRSHGPSHDVTGLETVLAEGSLDSHLKSVAWQRENNAYYLITVHESRAEEFTLLSSTEAEVLVDKVESREFYIDGKLGTENTVYNDHYEVRYRFKRIGEAWYIVDRTVITLTPTATPTASGPDTPTPSATKKPATPTPVPLASNVRDFSGTQGANGWKYLMENGRNSGSWKEMRFDDYKGKPCWLTDNWETDVRICGDGELAPGMSTRVAYEWRTDASRRVQVRIQAKKTDTRCGDGVQVTVQRVVDRQGSQTLESFHIAAGDSKGVSKTYAVDVGPGVFVLVFADVGGNSQCDATRLTIDVY